MRGVVDDPSARTARVAGVRLPSSMPITCPRSVAIQEGFNDGWPLAAARTYSSASWS